MEWNGKKRKGKERKGKEKGRKREAKTKNDQNHIMVDHNDMIECPTTRKE
jgi:hypothetical protein